MFVEKSDSEAGRINPIVNLSYVLYMMKGYQTISGLNYYTVEFIMQGGTCTRMYYTSIIERDRDIQRFIELSE
jgi:hypothetical protein